MVFYMYNTTKVKGGYRYTVRRFKARKTKNTKGSYLDSKVIRTGKKSTRARATAQAKNYIRGKR